MSVRVRPCGPNRWAVDVIYRLPNGRRARDRRRVRVTSKSAAQRWGEGRERQLIMYGPTPEPEPKEVPTLGAFAPRWQDGYARANRHKPSGIAAKETIIQTHLVPLLGTKRLDTIGAEEVQQLKFALRERAPKTINNVVTTLNVLLKTAVEWHVIEKLACTIRLLKIPKAAATFHDFEEFERLVEAARTDDSNALLIALIGGEAGLRCGELMALERTDIDLAKRQIKVERSDWKGHITATKGGIVRFVPLTQRLAAALRAHRHLRATRVLCQANGAPLTQKIVQDYMSRAARRANVKPGVHILRHTFCSHLAMKGAPARAIQELAGHVDLKTTQR